MPANKELLYPLDWLRKAENDFKRVSLRPEEGDIEDAAFHLEQALEKYLKGFLLFHGWKLKKIHDLEALPDESIKYEGGLEQFRPLVQQVTSYDLIDRYPTFEEPPSKEEVSRAYQETKSLVRFVQSKVVSGKRKK